MRDSPILDRFRLEEELGSGAHGTVRRAWDTRLGREVAIKSISTEGADDERVMREAQAVARLSHHGIVTLYEVGLEDEHLHLVTELIEGIDLRRALDRGSLSDRDVADIGADLCEALDHAHSRGVIHRDIKPANVLVADADGRAKLMDFGVARLTDQAGLTATGDVVGTLAYMSPEQAEGHGVGPQSDVYSLCLMLYEALSGENPNRRRTPAETIRAMGGHPPALSARRRGLPQVLTDAIDAGLDPDPELRPTLEDLGGALERALPALDWHATGDRSRVRPGTLATGSALPARTLLATGAIASMAIAALAFDSPGLAIVIAVCLLPVALFVRASGALCLLPLAVPLLGLLGLAPAYPALAGLARNWRERVLLALSGIAVLIAAQVAAAREMGLGRLREAPEGWSGSVADSLVALFAPFIDQPRLLATAAIWVAAAVIAGILIAPMRAWTGGNALFRRIDDDPPTEPTRSKARSLRSR